MPNLTVFVAQNGSARATKVPRPETGYIATKRVDSIKAKKLSRSPRDLRGTCVSCLLKRLMIQAVDLVLPLRG